MEETYYKKILASSGEVPERSGRYITNSGLEMFRPSKGFFKIVTDRETDELIIKEVKPEYWLKPVPSPKQEIEQLIEDYHRRLTTIKKEIADNHGKMKTQRLSAKVSCYRAFITELERVIR